LVTELAHALKIIARPARPAPQDALIPARGALGRATGAGSAAQPASARIADQMHSWPRCARAHEANLFTHALSA
jgi:hypothetical protein